MINKDDSYSSFGAGDVSIVVDEDNEAVLIKMGQHAASMSIGEWSKLISHPTRLPRTLR